MIFMNILLFVFVISGLPSDTLFPMLLLFVWLLIIVKLLTSSNHVLLILLLLETIMLSSMLAFSINQINFSSNSSFLMMFFTLAVCEASLGLGLLIQISRKMGSELMTCF